MATEFDTDVAIVGSGFGHPFLRAAGTAFELEKMAGPGGSFESSSALAG